MTKSTRHQIVSQDQGDHYEDRSSQDAQQRGPIEKLFNLGSNNGSDRQDNHSNDHKDEIVSDGLLEGDYYRIKPHFLLSFFLYQGTILVLIPTLLLFRGAIVFFFAGLIGGFLLEHIIQIAAKWFKWNYPHTSLGSELHFQTITIFLALVASYICSTYPEAHEVYQGGALAIPLLSGFAHGLHLRNVTSCVGWRTFVVGKA